MYEKATLKLKLFGYLLISAVVSLAPAPGLITLTVPDDEPGSQALTIPDYVHIAKRTSKDSYHQVDVLMSDFRLTPTGLRVSDLLVFKSRSRQEHPLYYFSIRAPPVASRS